MTHAENDAEKQNKCLLCSSHCIKNKVVFCGHFTVNVKEGEERPLDFIWMGFLRINNEAAIILNSWLSNYGECVGFRYIKDV